MKPKILVQMTLSERDRAIIMGGREVRDRGHDDGKESSLIRIVQVEVRSGWPIVVVETTSEETDAMGTIKWYAIPLPVQIVAAVILREQGMGAQ